MYPLPLLIPGINNLEKNSRQNLEPQSFIGKFLCRRDLRHKNPQRPPQLEEGQPNAVYHSVSRRCSPRIGYQGPQRVRATSQLTCQRAKIGAHHQVRSPKTHNDSVLIFRDSAAVAHKGSTTITGACDKNSEHLLRLCETDLPSAGPPAFCALAFQLLPALSEACLLRRQSRLRLPQLLFHLVALFDCLPNPLLSRFDLRHRLLV